MPKGIFEKNKISCVCPCPCPCLFCLEKDKSQVLNYLQQAISLNPKDKEDGKTDTDFQALVSE